MLVDFRALGAGQSITLRCLDARWDLVKFVGTGQPGVAYSPPPVLSTIFPLGGPSQPTRSFTFDGMSRINGLEYDPPGPCPRRALPVVSRTGGRGRLFAWEGGWKDTVLLNDRERVDVLIRFNAYRGRYLIHCRQPEHESMGMMANFEVV